MTTAPAKPRPPPAITCSNSTRPAARRCCRSMAARSRPIAGSPRRRWNGSRPICAAPRRSEGWTAKSPLPGGDIDVSAIAALTAELVRNYPFLDAAHASRLAHAYGTRAAKLLGNAKSLADLGQSFGASLTESEVRYLMASGVGPHRRGYRLAAIQARIAAVGRRNRRPRRLDCRQPRSDRTSLAGSGRADMTRHARPRHAISRWHPDHSRCLADARARHLQRAARTDAVGQDLDHAAAGRSRQADHRAACWSTARMSPASTCASARWRWSISSSSITPR